MGQQVPFQTLMDVTRVIQKAAGSNLEPSIRVKAVRFEDQEQPLDTVRIEMDLIRQGEAPHEIHLYEAYWAPLTEGQTNVRDVVSFLSGAAFDGLRRASSEDFWRWMFGRKVSLDPHGRKAQRRLLFALLVVLSLIVVNFAIGAFSAARVLQSSGPRWPSDRTILFSSIGLMGAAFALGLAGLRISRIRKWRDRNPGRPARKFQIGLAWTLLWSGLVALSVAAVSILILSGMDFVIPAGMEVPGLLKGWIAIGVLAIWTLMVLISRGARYFLVQYVGDVVAYVSAHKVSKFAEVRESIQRVCYRLGKAIYAAEEGAEFLYGRVIVVGHSLGSVVAYDTLNAVIREDQITGGSLSAARRTPLLLTFGSPLNKTAFIFRTQTPQGSELREALASTKQPIIQGYDDGCRPAEWVNIHSPADWISGRVEYYDDLGNVPPNRAQMPVQNKIDPEATTPLVAHCEYWTNKLLGEELWKRI